jgi:spermidine synthase
MQTTPKRIHEGIAAESLQTRPDGVVDRALAVDGTELALVRRQGVFTIRADGLELVSSRAHASEELLANLVCDALGGVQDPRVLIGGLGMGFTLRAALERLPRSAFIVVAEIYPAVVSWCRGPLSGLSRGALDDRRVEVVETDVLDLVDTGSWDAILLDVDNGPQALSVATNQRLYTASGLALMGSNLEPGGCLGVWSASSCEWFERRLGEAGFDVHRRSAPAAPRSTATSHTLYLARRPADDERGEGEATAEEGR